MDIRKVKKLIELLEESGLSEIEITEGDDKVRISKQTTVSKSSNDSTTIYANDTYENNEQLDRATSLPTNGFHEVKAPMIGTYYQASEPNAEAFVKVGDPVSEGDTLCIIEAMKMMNKIESDVDGIVERILVQNGDPVEYDEVLFLISKN
ncbi:MAG: acetyl-CoA carboxylase biotin carboxyl carrier protein [Gammaproteobacteria bacterium]|nr:acetyl-CoA carboxylase biotin carboxyl carrier protein [Gammaproteobacteria bacterium]